MTDLARPVPASELDEVLRLTAPSVWDVLRGQALFLTGGTGFVGKWLLECLLHADRALGLGLRVTVLTREPDRFAQGSPHLAKAKPVELHRGDVVDFEFPGGTFSSIIHAALPVAPPGADLGRLEHLSEAGTRRACEFAAASGVRRLLHVSSGAVYGAQPGVARLAESQPWHEANGANAYTRAKRRAESVVTQPWPFEVVVARCFAFLGPYLLPSSGAAAAQFIAQAANGQGIVVQGSGEAIRTYQYAGDMARWLLSCLALGAPGRAYNVGGDNEVTIAELAGEVTRVARTGIPVQVAGRTVPGLAGHRYVPDVKRAADELGLTNAVGLEEGIRRTLSWLATPGANRSFSS
ncbi:NAD-dependent epimerase/dehydratase family protein [Variovorax boronicumulans]|uniref:NAD-dependent epimerase/dehydratase family protein n=1 Tax=Variovorax boronicumulans TaxID=436515 RepID=UPI0036F28CC6